MNSAARVESGITNLAISNAVEAQGFFYAPDPSSQLACTLAGNIGMNSGGAHCLKYGVTTNNVLGLKMVLMAGGVIECGGGRAARGPRSAPRQGRRCAFCAGPTAHVPCCSASTPARLPASALPPS